MLHSLSSKDVSMYYKTFPTVEFSEPIIIRRLGLIRVDYENLTDSYNVGMALNAKKGMEFYSR